VQLFASVCIMAEGIRVVVMANVGSENTLPPSAGADGGSVGATYA